MTRGSRIYPASVAGFDHASGFGLVRVTSGLNSGVWFARAEIATPHGVETRTARATLLPTIM